AIMKKINSTQQRSLRQFLLAAALFALASNAANCAEAEVIFDGKDLSGWRKPTGEWMTAKAVALDPANSEKLAITPGEGVLVNGPAGKAKDFVTEKEFGDVEVHVEFC